MSDVLERICADGDQLGVLFGVIEQVCALGIPLELVDDEPVGGSLPNDRAAGATSLPPM